MTKEKRVHGMTGRRNAAHAVTPNSHLCIRVNADQRREWAAAAKEEGKTMSVWIIDACNWRILKGLT